MLSWGSLHKTNNTNIKPITASLAVLCRYVRATHQNLYLFLYYLQLPMQSKHNTPKVVKKPLEWGRACIPAEDQISLEK
jgi:hypothetical protein